ncbi:MAG: 50S ribosomal protein L21 [Alphaproteobacteria bacterium]
MFAIIKTGGKQFKVQKDDVLAVDKLEGKAGDKLTITEVLMADGKVGTPTLAGATVAAEIVRQVRDEKVLVFKKKRRHGYKRKNGHRQQLTLIKILDIKA